MDCEIVFLPCEKWQDYPIEFRYETSCRYEPEIYHHEDGFGAVFTKKAYSSPQVKEFIDKLYNPLWQGSKAYGIFSETDSEKLIACIELWKNKSTNFMWLNELWVAEEYRRCGLGKKLLDFAKQTAKEEGCRVLQLETHSNNENAVAFYRSQGLTFFGFEKALYTNRDKEEHKVCIELGMFIR
ncbi:MAG: GNAT family N-acetyltransferase [Oscillospiraceae bacterium]|nr:GNAT family N-acetyltransferase [Oscillospiraceae bacterium]